MISSELFSRNVLQQFDFESEYIGYVLDNTEFEETLKVKIFIPELFGYTYSPTISSENNEISISTDHIINISELNMKTDIIKREFVYAKILLERHFLHSQEEFLRACKPNIGDKVIVRFLNGNPNNCIYTNTLFLSDGESISIEKNNNENDNPIINIINNNTSNRAKASKITWEFD